jgi:uncharacterized protein (DUF1778 family)
MTARKQNARTHRLNLRLNAAEVDAVRNAAVMQGQVAGTYARETIVKTAQQQVRVDQ